MSAWDQLLGLHDVVLDHIDKLMTDLIPLAEKSVFLYFPAVDEALKPVGESVGFDVDMLKVRWSCAHRSPLCCHRLQLEGPLFDHDDLIELLSCFPCLHNDSTSWPCSSPTHWL